MTWIEKLRLVELIQSAGYSAVLFFVGVLVVFLSELRGGADIARYRTRAFLTDAAYSLFYRGGFFQVFVFAAIMNALDAPLRPLKLNLLSDVSLPVAMLLFWVGGDFVLYWLHRLQHSVPWLWELHRVHHSQETLTPLTADRRHLVEHAYQSLVIIVVFVFILGIPSRTWLPLFATFQLLQAVHHAELNWRFGPLYRFVVSPVFHSVHHSAARQDYDQNFGALFSVWDYVFGTASPRVRRPTHYGVDGPPMPASIVGQFTRPFRAMWQSVRRVDQKRPRASEALDEAAERTSLT